MALSIDELSSLYGLNSVNGVAQTATQTVTETEADKKAMDGDSYISTIAGYDPNAAIPSENYNDLAKQIMAAARSEKTNTAETAKTEDTQSSGQAAESTQAAGGGSGSGGGSSDEDEDETTTEIVTINGQTYLQTTTTDSSGNTTVTRVPIGGEAATSVSKTEEIE